MVPPDNWKIAGCPVNGPALSVEDGRAVVAWYTGSKDEPKVFVAFAPNADHGFENPVRLDDGKPFGRVDIAWLGEGSALVIWLEGVDGGGAEVRARRVHPVGRIERSFVVAPSTSARSSGFPRLARAGREILVAWTDVAEPSRVRVARFAASREAR